MKKILRRFLAILPLTLMGASATVGSAPDRDYTFMWWAYGWRGASPTGEKVLNIRTDRYGLALDVEKATLLHLGSSPLAKSYEEAASESNAAVFALPRPRFVLSVLSEGTVYRCTVANPNAKSEGETAAWAGDFPEGTDPGGFPLRMIESGRFVQRADLMHLEFYDEMGARLNALGRLEIVAWPDRLNFLLELTPLQDLADTRISIELLDKKSETPLLQPKAGQTMAAAMAWSPNGEVLDPPPGVAVTATDRDDSGAAVPVVYEATGGWFRASMKSRDWNAAKQPDRLDRFPIQLSNPADREQVFRLQFEFEGKDSPGLTGLSPMLRDAEGEPTGIPVQISKNWHGTPGKTFLYQGPWFRGSTMIRVPAAAEWRGEFVVAYARWGGVPAASHGQLSLIGWGSNQLWDQVAIGAWGESICYDPDVNLNRSMIDDLRPLMVWGMGEKEHRKWTWTNNVGGGDFLVYFDAANRKQFLTRVKTAYSRYCPNLTQVTYSGVSADGHIAASLTVSTPRTDDINRAFHHLRYDVLKPTPFTRLAFYQVGSDGYNNHQFDRLALGSAEGVAEEWSFPKGGLRYDRKGIPCPGEAPWWFSLHEAVPPTDPRAMKGGAWANRGLIVRSWKARLGGREVSTPYASFFGTENHNVPGMNVELSPPPGIDRLEPGDFVEADLELGVFPLSADDYYGPNENLRAALEKNANTWKMVHREAVGNDLKVECSKGRLERAYPAVIEVDSDRTADFRITGGVGYVPVTFTGLDRPDGYDLYRVEGEESARVDQSVHGNDFWQTDRDPTRDRETWTRTYNLGLDTPEDKPKSLRFRFEKSPQPSE